MGEYTTNNYFYKPDHGAHGQDEKNKFDDALDSTDQEISDQRTRLDSHLINVQKTSYYDHSLSTALEANDGVLARIYMTEDNSLTADFTEDLTGIDVIIEKGKTLTLDGITTIDFNIMVEDGAQVSFDQDCTVNGNLESKGTNSGIVAFDAVTGDETLTTNGFINAGLWQIFGSSLTIDGDLDIGYPEWFGATTSTDNATTNTTAINTCLSIFRTVELRQNVYPINDTIKVWRSVSWKGMSHGSPAEGRLSCVCLMPVSGWGTSKRVVVFGGGSNGDSGRLRGCHSSNLMVSPETSQDCGTGWTYDGSTTLNSSRGPLCYNRFDNLWAAGTGGCGHETLGNVFANAWYSPEGKGNAEPNFKMTKATSTGIDNPGQNEMFQPLLLSGPLGGFSARLHGMHVHGGNIEGDSLVELNYYCAIFGTHLETGNATNGHVGIKIVGRNNQIYPEVISVGADNADGDCIQIGETSDGAHRSVSGHVPLLDGSSGATNTGILITDGGVGNRSGTVTLDQMVDINTKVVDNSGTGDFHTKVLAKSTANDSYFVDSGEGLKLNGKLRPFGETEFGAPVYSIGRDFSDGDTTPDVTGGTYFKTNNSSATTITDFDNPDDPTGQIIFVEIGDANTTIQDESNGSDIALQSGTDETPAEGTIYMFVFNNTYLIWKEIGHI